MRYTLSIRRAGLGDRLVCLAAAWIFSKRTGRTLVADWRFGAYSQGRASNLFTRVFDTRDNLAGVRFIADESCGGLALPRPRYPRLWNDDELLKRPFRRQDETLLADRAQAVHLVKEGGDLPAATVVFDTCIASALELVADARTFFRELTPKSSVSIARDEFMRSHFGSNKVIALHVRHGNGGDIMDHARYWHSFPDAILRCLRAVRTVQAELGRDAPVFLSTDSIEVEQAVRGGGLANALSRPQHYRAAGTGELHLETDSDLILDDALVDMLLLAESHVLIRYPPASLFSFYGAAMKATCMTPVKIEDLEQASDPTDALSPAIVQ